MKLIELFDGRKIPASNAEFDFLEKLSDKMLSFEDLEDRQKQIVLDLYMKNVIEVSDRGLIIRKNPIPHVDLDWS